MLLQGEQQTRDARPEQKDERKSDGRRIRCCSEFLVLRRLLRREVCAGDEKKCTRRSTDGTEEQRRTEGRESAPTGRPVPLLAESPVADAGFHGTRSLEAGVLGEAVK